MKSVKLLFFVTEDWYFCSHRLPLAVAAKNAGYEVVIVTRVREHGEIIRAAGLRLIPLELSRRGMNPLKEIATLLELRRIYRQEQPDILHHVALKPVLYGSLAAWLVGCGHVVNAMAGMGFLFVSRRKKAKLLRPLVGWAFRLLLNRPGSSLIVQNPDDFRYFKQSGLIDPKKIAMIRGAGVDMQQFAPVGEARGKPVVMLASRLLWDKGVGEFVEAASLLRQQGVAARFVLVGEGDPENPANIPLSQIEAWRQSGDVELWGHRNNMAEVIGQAHVVCLPSYREGLPKVLLEAASCAKPIVTTDVPG
ncbi:MAG: glycosyltransferase family 4 protein, partial [Desulfurivibrionaceae bacterium]